MHKISHPLKPVLHFWVPPAAPPPYFSSQKPKIYRHKNSHPLNPYLSSQKPKIYRHRHSRPLKPMLYLWVPPAAPPPHFSSQKPKIYRHKNSHPLNPYLSSQKPKIYRHRHSRPLKPVLHSWMSPAAPHLLTPRITIQRYTCTNKPYTCCTLGHSLPQITF